MYRYSKFLLANLNYLDFLLLMGQSHDKVCFSKSCGGPLYEAIIYSSILQIRETGFKSGLKNHSF
jgi:hypothetical protein